MLFYEGEDYYNFQVTVHYYFFFTLNLDESLIPEMKIM